MRHRILFLVAFGVFISSTYVYAQEKQNPFSASVLLTADYFNVMSGGIKTGMGGLADVSVQLGFDTEKAGWWKGGSFLVYALGNYGDKPNNSHVGSNQAFDNIETFDKHQLFEYWYKHQFSKGYIVLGQSNVNAEFFHSNTGSRLINSNFNTPADITANIHAPIFSKATLGMKFKYEFTPQTHLLGCVYNGYEGSPEDNPYNTFFAFRKKDGLLWMTEANFYPQEQSTETNIKLGAWLHTGLFLNVTDSLNHPDRGGVYLMAEKDLLCVADNKPGVTVFFMTGYVPTRHVLVRWFLASGLSITGILHRKLPDFITLGYTTHRLNSDIVAHYPLDRRFHEHLAELTWQIPLNKHIAIQPDLQYIIHPGATRNISHALIGILRVQCNLSTP
jgi:porin